MRWTTSHTKIMMGKIKVDPKKNVYHSTFVIEILMLHFFFKTTQQIPPKDVPTRVYDASTSRVNTSKLKEQLQVKRPLAPSSRSPR